MSDSIAGIHHVTTIAGDAQRNINFYAGTLGLRLVKRTVNFDDPFTYHFYYGDEEGRPGTILTFFPWGEVRRGRQGTGQATAASFRINESSVSYWLERLISHNVEFSKPVRRFGESVISFRDHDGLMLELIAAGNNSTLGWSGGTVPAEHALRRFHNVTLCVEALEHTGKLLTDVMGFRPIAEEGSRTRFATGDGGSSSIVDVECAPDFWSGVVAGGTVHHVAWRAEDDEAQLRWRERLVESGVNVTPVLDRQYFHSIYFREPGGVLFEIATDPPGFAKDERVERLGTELKLPIWLESNRAEIEARLPPLEVPGAARVETKREDEGEEMTGDLGFIHRFIPAEKSGTAATLLLLHGTGGDEDDLLPLGQRLASGESVNILSPRGKVLERGMPRFFRRLAEGVFDEEDVVRRADELAGFVKSAAARYGFDARRVVAIGYSNGANIAAAMMMLHTETLAGGVFFHAQPVLSAPPPAAAWRLGGKEVFLSGGHQDPVVPAEETERLAELLRRAEAEVRVSWQTGGHALTSVEIEEARVWLSEGKLLKN